MIWKHRYLISSNEKYLWIYSFCLVKRIIWIYFLPFKLANTFTLSVSHRIAFCVLADKYRDFLRSSCRTGPFNLGLLFVFFFKVRRFASGGLFVFCFFFLCKQTFSSNVYQWLTELILTYPWKKKKEGGELEFEGFGFMWYKISIEN